MEILKTMAYAGFGFLVCKISGSFIQNFILPVIIGVVSILIIFLLTEVVIPFLTNRR